MNNENSDLLIRYKVILKHKMLLAYFLATAFVCVTFYNFFCERMYKSETTIFPIESSKNDMFSALTGQGILGALSGIVGGLTTSTNKLINVLESKTVSENVINSLNLMPLLFPKEWDEEKNGWVDPENKPFMEDAVDVLQNDIVSIKSTKRGIVSVSIVFPDPKVAKTITNQYVIELQNFLNQNSLSLGKKNRIFLEEQLSKTKVELAESANKLKTFQEEHKIISINAQADMTVRTVANLKAEILSRDYQLGVLRNTTGLSTGESKKILEEKRQLHRQLKKLEWGKSDLNSKKQEGSLVSMQDFPALEIQYLRLKRNFLILEKVSELLTTQYELAKIEEVRDQIAFQVIDHAKVPERRYKPKIILNTLIALFVAGLFGIFTIILIENFNWKSFINLHRKETS